MHRARAFFLTAGLGLMVGAVLLLLARPEPPDMRYREFLQIFMVVGFGLGFVAILVFTNRLRWLNITGALCFGLGFLAMYLAGELGGHSVGSAGWGVALIVVLLVLPASLIVFGLPGLLSLLWLLEAESKSRLGALAGLAVLVAAAAVVFGVLGAGPDMDRLLAEIHDPDLAVRQLAISELGRVDNVVVRQALEDLLHDPDPRIRAAAAGALGSSPEHFMAINSLTDTLRDEDPEVRRNAALALGVLIGRSKGYSDKVAELIDTLGDDNAAVRAGAAEALGWIGAKKAIEPLIGLLGDEAVRFQAHNALISITGKHFGDDPAEWREWLESK